MDWGRLVARAGAMMARPGRSWEEIGPEPGDPRTVLLGYVAPLAAIPAICGALGALVFGFRFADVTLRPSVLTVLLGAASGYVLAILCVWLTSLWIAVLAPAFGGLRERDQALKLAAYASTPLWLAGAASLYPSMTIPAALLGALYAGWMLLLGLPVMMRPRIDQTLTYFACVLLGVIVLGVLHAALASRVGDLGGPLMML